MSEQLSRSLTQLSERGHPRGADAVLRQARRQVEATPSRRPPSRAFGPAFAIAAVVLVTITGLLMLQLIRRSSTPTDDTTPVATAPPTTTETPDTVVIGAADDVVDLALAPDGRLWAATESGVVVWDLETVSATVFSENDGLGGRSVDHVAVASDGTAWAIGDSWLARYDGGWTLLGDVDADLLTPVGDMAIGPDGAAWIAAGGPDALVRVDTDGATTYAVPEGALLATPWARSIAVDADGTVWASTWQSGVFAFDGEWQHFGVDDGLPSEVVGNIAMAPDGAVWVGGDGLYGELGGDIPAGGILRYRDGTWTVYTTADGLLGNDGDVTVDPSGGVWVVHHALPDNVAEQLGVELPDGISHFDGSEWRHYPGIDGRGPGVVTVDGTLWLPSAIGITGTDGVTTTHLTAGPDAVPPAPAGQPVQLEPADGIEPVGLSTSIGEIEFTTWMFPDGGDPPLLLIGTDHGVIGDLPPDGTPAWSPDGTTWNEIYVSLEPTGWSDQTAAYGDDLYVFVERGVARMSWDGADWVEVETFETPRVYRGAAGPAGIVAVGTEQIHYWDGERFTEASRPPDKTLHPEPGGGCSAPGWQSEGIMAALGPVAATDDGFVAVAARSESGWYRTPVCEPLVWLSSDGDVWTPSSDESPFGERAFVHDIAVVGDRILAVGGVSIDEAAVWTSDNGIDWQRADLEAAQLWHVAGSDRGWIAVGNHESNLSAQLGGDMWFSADGLVWDGPYERPPGWADATGIVGVAMLDNLIVGSGEQLNRMPAGSAGLIVGKFMDE